MRFIKKKKKKHIRVSPSTTEQGDMCTGCQTKLMNSKLSWTSVQFFQNLEACDILWIIIIITLKYLGNKERDISTLWSYDTNRKSFGPWEVWNLDKTTMEEPLKPCSVMPSCPASSGRSIVAELFSSAGYFCSWAGAECFEHSLPSRAS